MQQTIKNVSWVGKFCWFRLFMINIFCAEMRPISLCPPPHFWNVPQLIRFNVSYIFNFLEGSHSNFLMIVITPTLPHLSTFPLFPLILKQRENRLIIFKVSRISSILFLLWWWKGARVLFMFIFFYYKKVIFPIMK